MERRKEMTERENKINIDDDSIESLRHSILVKCERWLATESHHILISTYVFYHSLTHFSFSNLNSDISSQPQIDSEFEILRFRTTARYKKKKKQIIEHNLKCMQNIVSFQILVI